MPKSPPRRLALFAAGAFAPLSVFAVFYSRNISQLFADFDSVNSSEGAAGIALVVILNLVVAAIAGGWAVFSGCRTYLTAFSTGLGVPGLILGGSSAAGIDSQTKNASIAHVQSAALFPAFPLAASGGSDAGIFEKAFQVVFNPIGTTAKTRLKEATSEKEVTIAALQDKNQRLNSDYASMIRQTNDLKEQSIQLKQQIAIADQNNQRLLAQIQDTRVASRPVFTQVDDDAIKRMSVLERNLANVQRERDGLKKKVADLEAELERLKKLKQPTVVN